MAQFASVEDMVRQTRPTIPVHCMRPHVLHTAASWFVKHFPGHIFYAVKTNPDAEVMKHLYAAGVRRFDVASLTEVRQVAELFPDAMMAFMHPVKGREAIRKAYFDYGVRDFSLDSFEELQKILEETDWATDLGLHVRMSIPNGYAALQLAGKFGVLPHQAPALLKEVRRVAARVGICFHVGSQCMNPAAYRAAMLTVKEVMEAADVVLDVVDVGGGFPSTYPDMTPPPLNEYMDVIRESIAMLDLPETTEIWAEPGRALVAEAGSLVVRVELRKGNQLYINDGVYGSLFDAGSPGFVYYTRVIKGEGSVTSGRMAEFELYGPTCDSLDTMKGPFLLPANVVEGDWIEFGQMGAYGATLRTGFNGFQAYESADVADAPICSLFGFAPASLTEAVGQGVTGKPQRVSA
jgi:ornithine decarboxylase